MGNQLEDYPNGTAVLFKIVGNVEDQPSQTPTPVQPKPTPQPTENNNSDVIPGAPTSFKNCTEMREYYPNGVSEDHPAYASKHDRVKDGWACER
ncbi:MAG: excalibur calcium-binding domain-containing protein [Lysinibacillus sp.]|nr:excalibur calcium-binding domain-containing protein [Lysinibacillus sp.]